MRGDRSHELARREKLRQERRDAYSAYADALAKTEGSARFEQHGVRTREDIARRVTTPTAGGR